MSDIIFEDNEGYRFELKDNLEILRTQQDYEVTKYKIILGKFELENRDKKKLKLKYICFIPSNYSDSTEYLKSIESKKLKMYDYYIYFNLDPDNDQYKLYTRIEIGNLILNKSGSGFNQEWNTDFKKNQETLKRYVEIETIIQKSKVKQPDDNNRVSDQEWADRIKKEYKDNKEENKKTNTENSFYENRTKEDNWYCQMCEELSDEDPPEFEKYFRKMPDPMPDDLTTVVCETCGEYSMAHWNDFRESSRTASVAKKI